MPELPDDPFEEGEEMVVPDACAAIGMAVLDILADDPDMAAVIVIVRDDLYDCYGVYPAGLENFMLNDAEDDDDA